MLFIPQVSPMSWVLIFFLSFLLNFVFMSKTHWFFRFNIGFEEFKITLKVIKWSY